MKVWFGCTSAKLDQYISLYKSIRNHLIQKGCVVLYDWLEEAEKDSKRGERDIKKIYKEIVNAINQSDICIIENTVSNFSVAHQINYALSRQKPTLVLWQHKDNEPYSNSYLEAMESKYLIVKEYDDSNLFQIIDEFIGISKLEFGQKRYNVVLENKQRFYLDWASATYKKSRSHIIRDAIDEMSDFDKEFKKYFE